MNSAENKVDVKEKNKTINKIILWVFLAGMLIIFLVGILNSSQTRGEGWEVISTQDYVRDGQKCIAYRVYIEENFSSDEMKDVFVNVTKSDSKYLHTVWFYRDKDKATGGRPYDYAEMEQTIKDVIPLPHRK